MRARAVLVWLAISLLAVATIDQRPYVGLTIAIAGGALLGVYAVLSTAPDPIVSRNKGAGAGEADAGDQASQSASPPSD